MASVRSRSAPSTWRCGMQWPRLRASRLFRMLAERHKRTANPRVFVYAAGGYYYPGKDLSALRGEMRSYLDRGYNVVKMKIGGAPIEEDRHAHRSCIEGDRQCTPGSPSMPTAGSTWRRRSPTPKCCATIRCSGTRRPATPWTFQLQAALAEFYPGPMATGENLFSHQDARNLIRFRRDAARPRLAAIRLRAVLRALRIPAHARRCCKPRAGRRADAFRMAATRCR